AMIGFVASAEAQFTYVTNNGAITITGYTGPGGAVAIPDTINSWPVVRIGNSAFYGSRSLTNITIPNSVTSIGYRAFAGCTRLAEITVDAQNAVYSSVNGVLFDKSQAMLIEYPAGKVGGYTIPNSASSIG